MSLTREEVERRLEETDYDLGGPSRWPEMHMEACRCLRCGRWLQIVRPGKYQCECENEPEEKYREREALQTALAAMDERDEILTAKKRDSQMAISYYSKYQKAIVERDAFAAEGRLMREVVQEMVDCQHCIPDPLYSVPLISAEVERVRRLEAVLEAAEALIDSRGAHIEGCVPLKNAIAAYREGEK